MNPLWLIVGIVIGAVSAGAIVFVLMRARLDVKLAGQREELAGARAGLIAEKEALEGSLKNAEESTRRRAMDDFLADIRVEERHFIREHKVLFITRKLLVRQERIFFRNIPLSNWIEHESPLEEGADVESMVKAMSVFAPGGLLDALEAPPRKVLR